MRQKTLTRIVISIFVFNVLQVIAWAILFYPSMTVWRKSIQWIVFMSWYANQVGAIAALGTAVIMLIQMRQENQ